MSVSVHALLKQSIEVREWPVHEGYLLESQTHPSSQILIENLKEDPPNDVGDDQETTYKEWMLDHLSVINDYHYWIYFRALG